LVGFWGKCYNDYANTPAHEGYSILRTWREKLFPDQEFQYEKNGDTIKRNLHRMQIYTSNVDRMFHNAGFSADEIEEIHGNALTMQCSKPCSQKVWKLPADFRFQIDPETMRCSADQHPKCKCGRLARPNVMMFCDPTYFRADSANPDYNYWNFQSNVEQVLRTRPGSRLAILEIGAGKRVPSVRVYSQRFLNDSSLPSGSVTLIRVNPDFPELDPLQIQNDGTFYKSSADLLWIHFLISQ
jgi:NAD-dependent SIR2 family protein deacetylase